MIFNRKLGNCWSDLDDFFGRPPWNFDSGEKISPLARLRASWNLCAAEFPHYNADPFDGFHKFRRSRGLNSSGDETTFEAFVESKYASANTLSKRGKYSHRITQCLWKPSLLLWPMIIANAAGSFSTDGLAAASLIFLRKTNWDLCSRQKIASPN